MCSLVWSCSSIVSRTVANETRILQRILLSNFHNAQVCGLHCGKTNNLIKSEYNYYTKRYQRPLSPPKRKCKTVLEFGFHAVEFGFQIMDSGFFVSGNRLRDSGFHQQKFRRFRILDFPKEGSISVDTVNFFTPTVMDMSIFLTISNSSVYNTKLLNRNLVFLIPTTLSARKASMEITRRNSKWKVHFSNLSKG